MSIPSKRECLDRYSISGINETSNGFTLCWNCHQAFDNYLVCVDPVTSNLLVTEALQEHEPTKWKKLHGKCVTPAKFNWPSNGLVTYRFDKMHAKQEERAKHSITHPFRCRTCGIKLKSLKGLGAHSGSQKCSRSGMAKYTTPIKFSPLDEELLDEEVCY